MAERVHFHLFIAREHWSNRDHAELNGALCGAGLIPEGGTWRATAKAGIVRFDLSVQPSRGRVRLAFDRDDWEDRPGDVARVAVATVKTIAERTDCYFGTGPTTTTPRRPRGIGDIRALTTINVIGTDLAVEVDMERLHKTPGLLVEALPFGATLLRMPYDVASASWTPDVEARLLDAEMHLGLQLDPKRYPTLSGPAADYVRRVEERQES